MLTKQIKSECTVTHLIDGIDHRIELKTWLPTEESPAELYSLFVHTSPYLTDPARYHLFVNKEKLLEIYNAIGDILFYKEKREE